MGIAKKIKPDEDSEETPIYTLRSLEFALA